MRNPTTPPISNLRSSPAPARRSAGGFTLIEGSVVIIIISLLAGILLTALAGARRAARANAEKQFIATLKIGVQQFKTDQGILPPLVDDNVQLRAAGPASVVAIRGVPPANTNPSRVVEYLSFANAAEDTLPRYSELSLPYYLLGTLNAVVDGVDGLGFTQVAQDGQFTRKGRAFKPLVSTEKEAHRFGLPQGTPPDPTEPNRLARLWDGYSRNRINQLPTRYYRWLPTFYQRNDAPTPADVGRVKSYNVPFAVGDVKLSPGLRDAEFAVVGTGRDGLFGDEAGLSTSDAEAARADNIVEVGR